MRPWNTLRTSKEYENAFFRIMKDNFETGNGDRGEWFYHENNNAVTAIGQLEEDLFVFIREYRYVHNRAGIAVIAGAIDQGEDANKAVLREFCEEAGYKAKKTVELGTYATAPAFSKEVWTCYLLRDLEAAEAVKEPFEEIETVLLTRAQADEAVRTGQMWDSNAVAAWQLVKLYLDKEATRL